VLLTPTRIYVKPVLALAKTLHIKGMAHITGGGLTLNVPRMLPESVQAVMDRSLWPRPAVFDWLQTQGHVADDEMHRVFNCGIGMVLAVGASDVAPAIAALQRAGEKGVRHRRNRCAARRRATRDRPLTVASRPPRALPRTWRSHASRS
jgi:phosphoribosylformylglycinamidine cyclo-ligase